LKVPAKSATPKTMKAHKIEEAVEEESFEDGEKQKTTYEVSIDDIMEIIK